MARQQKVFTSTFTTNVTLTTTTEAVVQTLLRIPMTKPIQKVTLVGWAQLTTGAGATGVIARIRRTDLVGGALVGEATTITVGAAAGSNEVFTISTSEERAVEGSVDYNMTLEQAGATGNGTVLQGALIAIVE